MSGPRHLCGGCGIVPTPDRLCAGCSAAEWDTESPWDLQPYAPGEHISSGYWRLRRGVKEWVPLLVEEKASIPDPKDEGLYECEHCGVWYVRRNDRQMYCGERCKDDAYRERRRAREVAA